MLNSQRSETLDASFKNVLFIDFYAVNNGILHI